jgi:hypothetical protein
MPKTTKTIDQLLASDDPEDEAFLEAIFQADTFNDPEENQWCLADGDA